MVSFTILGLAVGGIYAISALGIVAVFRGSRVINFAHGGIALWTAYVFLQLRDEHDLYGLAAAAVALVLASAFGVVLYLLVFRPIRERSELVKLIMSLGVLVVLQGAGIERFGTQTELVVSSLPNKPVELLGATFGEDRLWILGIALVVAGAMMLWSRYSRLALATFALERNEEATVALGYSPHKLGALNWALGSALAGLSGILIVPITGFGVRGVTIILVPVLVAALVGRFESFGLAVVGALVIGVAEAQISDLVSTPGWSSAAPLIAAVIVLLFRRERGFNRLAAQQALAVGSGRVRWYWAVLVVGVAVSLTAFGSSQIQDSLVTTFTVALFSLGLVVLIGYANQISLAQLAIAGVGLLVAVRLNIAWNVPFIVAPLVGAAVGAIVGIVVGLPALRVRGINLAIVSLGLAVAIEAVVFQNADYTGGFNGLQPDAPSIFGINADALLHPGTYALVCLAWLLLAVGAVAWLRRSSLGREFIAVRTNERSAAAQGINVARAKVLAFAISSAIAGAAGVLMGWRQRTVVFDSYSVFRSTEFITLVVIAGVGAIGGAILAGTIAPAGLMFYVLRDVSFLQDHASVIFGIATIVILVVHPDGLLGPRRRRELAPELSAEPRGQPRGDPLVVRELSVHFGGVRAVHDCGLGVAPGEVLGLIGPNGGGKTTVLDAISGFAHASGGDIDLGGQRLGRHGPARRARLGVGRVFQSLELFEDLSIADNLRLAADHAGMPRNRLPAAAARFIEHTGLQECLTRRPSELSLGRRGAAAVARALALDPRVLLLDEPAAGLGAGERDELIRQVREVAAHGLGVVLVEHDLELVHRACDRVIVLVDGANFAEGTPSEIAQDADVRRVYLGEHGAVDLTAERTELDGTPPSQPTVERPG